MMLRGLGVPASVNNIPGLAPSIPGLWRGSQYHPTGLQQHRHVCGPPAAASSLWPASKAQPCQGGLPTPSGSEGLLLPPMWPQHHTALRRKQPMAGHHRQVGTAAAAAGGFAQPSDDSSSLQGSNSAGSTVPAQEKLPHRWKVVLMMAVSICWATCWALSLSHWFVAWKHDAASVAKHLWHAQRAVMPTVGKCPAREEAACCAGALALVCSTGVPGVWLA